MIAWPHLTRTAASALIGDEPLQEIDNVLLACGCRVEFAAHLNEPVVDMAEPFVDSGESVIHLGAHISHVFAQGVKTCHAGLAEVAELAMELRDVAVNGAGEDAGRRGILLTCLYSAG